MTKSFIFSPKGSIVIPVLGGTNYPVRRVYCVGRNYEAHALEMGNNPVKDPPFFFMKPVESIVSEGGEIAYPPETKEYHHEVELVVALKSGGISIRVADALNHVFGYAVGLDMTRRDLQTEAKKMGRPWDFAKGADQSAPISRVCSVEECGHLYNEKISLRVNGNLKQEAKLSDMIWGVAEIISYLSKYQTLQPGDLIFTGTPAGVGPVDKGDQLVAAISGVTKLTVQIN